MTKLVVAGTGHRPNALGGYSAETDEALIHIAGNALDRIRPGMIVTGMAQGWDMALAEAALRRNLAYIAAVPFLGQESVWPKKAQERYQYLLSHAYNTEIIVPDIDSLQDHERYVATLAAYQKRNEWMVDNSHLVLALWNGSKKGGTYNCIRYAEQVGVTVLNTWSDYEKYVREMDGAASGS